MNRFLVLFIGSYLGFVRYTFRSIFVLILLKIVIWKRFLCSEDPSDLIVNLGEQSYAIMVAGRAAIVDYWFWHSIM